jgi:chromosome partitioning protein
VGYDILAANQHLAGAEVELVEVDGRETILKRALVSVVDDYDFVLIDCPPALSLLTINGLTAAKYVIIPMQCEYYALEGLSDLVDTIKRIKSYLNPSLEIGGLVRTMFDGRNSLSQQVSDQLDTHFGDKLFETVIPRNVRVAEAPSHGLPVLIYDKMSKGAIAYQSLSAEFLDRFN